MRVKYLCTRTVKVSIAMLIYNVTRDVQVCLIYG